MGYGRKTSIRDVGKCEELERGNGGTGTCEYTDRNKHAKIDRQAKDQQMKETQEKGRKKRSGRQ